MSGQRTSATVPRVAPSAAARTEAGKLVPLGNGGFTDKYYWTQSLEEITVYVEIPHGTRGKHVDCEIHASRMKLAVKGEVHLEGFMDVHGGRGRLHVDIVLRRRCQCDHPPREVQKGVVELHLEGRRRDRHEPRGLDT